MNYAISRKEDARKIYLQGVEPNDKYSASVTAPTMGDRHSYSEYRTIWGSTPESFERMTATNYIKILFEEFRWKERTPFFFEIEPVCEEKKMSEYIKKTDIANIICRLEPDPDFQKKEHKFWEDISNEIFSMQGCRDAQPANEPLVTCGECVKYQTPNCAAKHEQALMDFCSHGIRKPGGEQT